MPTPSSSPPPLTRSRSRSLSDYSLDLDALMPPEEASEIMTPPRKTAIDVVHSEDIDGPTDFTQNLEYWMSAKLPNVTRPVHLAGPAKDDLETYVSGSSGEEPSSRGARDESKPSDAETPRRVEYGDDNDDMHLTSTMPSSLPGGDLHSSTPKTVEHAPVKKDLQASVEDHEDTPSRIRYSPSPVRGAPQSPGLVARSESPYEDESVTARALREMLIKLRDELQDVKLQGQKNLQRQQADYDRQVKQLQEAQKTRLDEEERVWEQRMAAAQSDFDRQLANSRASQSQKPDVPFDARLSELEARLAGKQEFIAQLQRTISQQGQDLEAARRETDRIKRDLYSTEERYRLSSEDQADRLSATEERLKSLRDSYGRLEKSKAETESRMEALQAELANTKLEYANEVNDLGTRIGDSALATQRIILEEKKASQVAMSELEYENARLHTQLDGKDDELDALKHELFTSKQQLSTTGSEKDQLATKLKEQKSMNDRAAREIQSLRAGSKISQSRSDDATKSQTAAIEALEQQLAEANAARLEADAEVDAAKADAAACRSEADLAKAELSRFEEDYALVNAAMDKRVRDVMKAREAEWTKRLEAVRREMGLRGEVLMREWGVKEMGLSEPQAYRYKYI